MIVKATYMCPACGKRHTATKQTKCCKCRKAKERSRPAAERYDVVPKCPDKLCEEPRDETFEWEHPEHAARFAEVKRVPQNKKARWQLPYVSVSDIPVRRGRKR